MPLLPVYLNFFIVLFLSDIVSLESLLLFYKNLSYSVLINYVEGIYLGREKGPVQGDGSAREDIRGVNMIKIRCICV
jgi:hypothetical protein